MSYLIGRDRQYNAILNSILKIIQGEAAKRVIFLTGEAGIGKSTLLGNLKSSLKQPGRFLEENRPIVANAECTTPIAGQEIGSAEALKPWADILQRLIVSGEVSADNKEGFNFKEFMTDTAPSWMKMIPVIGTTLEAAVEIGTKAYKQKNTNSNEKLAGSQEQIFQQYINFLSKASEQKPLIIIIDDFHWADDSSANLLFTAARQLASKRICFIISYRADEVEIARENKGHPVFHIANELERYKACERISLDRFTMEQVSEIIAAEYKGKGVSSDKNFVDWLMKASEGNALYIFNFLSKLHEEGFIDSHTGEILKDYKEVKAPEGNLALIRSRLKNIPPEEQEVPRYASVEGSTFTMEVLKELLEEKPLKLLQKLRILEEKSGLIESIGKQTIYTNETTAYKFSHVQIHRAMYESLEEEERELLHQAVFNVLEKEWEHAKESNYNIVSIATKIAVHAHAIGKYIYAAEALLEAAKESWRGYAADETLKLIDGIFYNLSEEAKKGKNDAEKLTHIKIDAVLLQCEVHVLQGRWKDSLNITSSVLELAESLPENSHKKKYISKIYASLGNPYKLLGEFENALKSFEKSLSISEELDDRPNIANSTGFIGEINFNLGNYEKALECYRRKLSISEELNDKKEIANVMGYLGNLYFAKGEYDTAMECHTKKLSISEELGDQRNIAFCLSSIGSIYYDRGDFDEALKCFERKLNISERLGDRLNISGALGNIGNVYYALGDFKKAIEYQEMKLKISEELGDLRNIARANGNLGVIYLRSRKFVKSLEHSNKALLIAETLADKQMTARTIGAMGAVYSTMGNHNKAIEYYEKELPICEALGDKLNMGVTFGNLGNNYYQLGKFNESYSYFNKALVLHRQIGYIDGIRSWLHSLSSIYLDEYENAEKMPSYIEDVSSDSKITWRESLLNKAEELANESNEMFINQVSHAEDLTNIKILIYRINHIRGNDSSIKVELTELLNNSTEYFKAAILYWLWKLSDIGNERENYRKEALSLYETLNAEAPNTDFEKLIEELRNS